MFCVGLTVPQEGAASLLHLSSYINNNPLTSTFLKLKYINYPSKFGGQ